MGLAREITELPHAPSGVAVFMPAHSKTMDITPSMDSPSRHGVVRWRRGNIHSAVAEGAAAGIWLDRSLFPQCGN